MLERDLAAEAACLVVVMGAAEVDVEGEMEAVEEVEVADVKGSWDG